ncbi:hypothetical protein BSKO_01396 [Bryopsis sp. KO-2023]|nr:hypothetical protein BSKO_01396 [Bryopsis sp. KO-2023]
MHWRALFAATNLLKISATSGTATFSTNTEGALKTCLRALYKAVHPDLFHDVPEQRSENERSMKLLQDYLIQAKDGLNGLMAPPPFRFVFFVKKSRADESSSDESDCGASESTSPTAQSKAETPVERVEIVIPPPPRNPTGDSLPLGARQGLAKLMAAVGVPKALLHNLAVEIESSSDRLRDFLPEAAEHVRLHEAEGLSVEAQVSNAKFALKLGRQVNVSLGEVCESLSPMRRVQFFEDLAWALDQAPEVDVSGLWMMVGDGSGIDANGRYWLPHNDTRREWVEHLVKMDVDSMKIRRKRVEEARRLETHVSQAMGVYSVYTSDKHRISPAYVDFLKRLMALAEKRGQIGNGRFRAIPVCFVPDMEEAGGCSINADVGFVTVACHVPPIDVYRFVQNNGAKVLMSLEQRQKDAVELEALKNRLRLRLRLRRLIKSPGITLGQFRDCCVKLAKHSPALMVHTDGLSLRVGKKNGFSKGGTVIDIAWDFEL